jgi:hypothetical protein
MSKLFLISEEEKNRILNLHETATKKHYIHEQSVIGAPNYGMINTVNSTPKRKKVIPKLTPKDKIIAVQKSLIQKGFNVGPTGADGDMGINTKNAIKSFQRKNNLTPDGIVGNNTAKALGVQPLTSDNSIENQSTSNVSKDSGFILVWSFPEYEPIIDGKGKVMQFLGSIIRLASGGGREGTYGKQGHGGCVIIKSNGDAVNYEFGRYPGADKGYGKVLTHPLGKIAKIKNGVLINPKEIASAARKKTYPPGPTMSMSVAVVKLPNPSEAERYASVKQREYSIVDFSIKDEDANCGTFARDVAYAGGIQMGTFCYPTPKAVVNSFRDKADKMFDI